VEPNAIVATTKIQKEEAKDLEEEEHMFHSHMWVKGSLLQFIIDSGNQKNLISKEVVKQLGLMTTTLPQLYTINQLTVRISMSARNFSFPTTSSTPSI
jgi:hypothetical protein